MIRNIIWHTLTIFLGCVFLLSGYLKLYPIEPFELTFVDLGVANWTIAPYLSRLLIASEFFLGFMLIAGIALKKFSLRATIFLLIFFTLYLFYQLITEGNTVNCGCFGTAIELTPVESIFKNGLMIVIAFLLYRFHPQFHYRFQIPLVILLSLVALVTPFVLNPPDWYFANRHSLEEINYPFDTEVLASDTSIHQPIPDFSKGKFIISVLSMTCSHCKAAAYKMYIIKKEHPEIPFHFLLYGREQNLQRFLDDTKSDNISRTIVGFKTEVHLSGGKVPAILWLDDGIVVKKSMFSSLTEDEILQWLQASSDSSQTILPAH